MPVSSRRPLELNNNTLCHWENRLRASPESVTVESMIDSIQSGHQPVIPYPKAQLP